MLDPTMNKKYMLVVGLFYPAMLGSVFYSFFAILQARTSTLSTFANDWPYCVLVYSTLVFYSIDYIYTASQPKLDWFSFFSSFIVMCSMYFAFDGVNIVSHPPHVAQHCYSMALTFTVFLIVDYLHRKHYGRYWRHVLIFEGGLVIFYTWFAKQSTAPGRVAVLSLIMNMFMIFVCVVTYYPEACSSLFSKVLAFLLQVAMWPIKRSKILYMKKSMMNLIFPPKKCD